MGWLMILLASIPILFLLIAITIFRINTILASAAAAAIAAILSIFIFGVDFFILGIASSKGLNLSIFVLLIVWTSLLFYNTIRSLGLMEVISSSISKITSNRLGLALLCGWTAAGFIEGIAGFGVPIAILAPLMISLGFKPLTAVVVVLVGHSWAVTFGGMAAAYYTLQLATGLQAEVIGPMISLLFILPIIITGLLVAFIEGGWQSLKRGLPVIIITGLVMSGCVGFSIFLNAPQVAAVTAGLVGTICIWGLSKTFLLAKGPGYEQPASINVKCREKSIGFNRAFLPYYLLIFLALFSQLPLIKQTTGNLHLAFDYPELRTSLGYTVPAIENYARINLFGHPAPIILVSTLATVMLFYGSKLWYQGLLMDAFRATYKQSWRPSLSVLAMVVMSLIMNDSGMTSAIASGIAGASGFAYPIISPFIGALGCFMTGSNANSNVMFGALQVSAASTLGISPQVIASGQTIGGSLGASIAPAKVFLGSSTTGMSGRESEIMRKTIIFCLIATLLVGLECWIAVQIFLVSG
jgi:lactate permease